MATNATPGGGVAARRRFDRTELVRLPRRSFARCLLTCLAVAACGESGTGPIEQRWPLDPLVLAEAEIEIASGDEQEGVVGAPLPEPLVIRVRDADGNPLAGAPVRWTFGAGRGGGRDNADRAAVIELTTGTDGEVAVAWELGTTSGPEQAWAEIPTADAPTTAAETTVPESDGPALAPKEDRGNGKKVGFNARGKAAEPAEILVSQTSLALEVGEAVMVSAVVVDRYGNEIPDAVVEWSSSHPSVASVSSTAAAAPLSYAFAPPGEGAEADEDGPSDSAQE